MQQYSSLPLSFSLSPSLFLSLFSNVNVAVQLSLSLTHTHTQLIGVSLLCPYLTSVTAVEQLSRLTSVSL